MSYHYSTEARQAVWREREQEWAQERAQKADPLKKEARPNNKKAPE